MIGLSLVEIGLVGSAVIHLVWLGFLSNRGVITLARHWLLGLVTVHLLTIVLHLATQDIPHTALWWFFNVNFENNFSSTFSALLLLLTGVMALAISFSLSRSSLWTSGVWFLWGAVCLFLSYDETYMWHEFIANWKIYFSVIGLVLITALLYAGQFLDRKNRILYLVIVMGLGITAGGGLLLDDNIEDSFLLEEFLELAGIIYTFAATFTYLQSQVGAQQRFVRPLLFGSGLLWVVALVFVNFWPLPVVEARDNAASAPTEYLDGALQLLGYRINQSLYHPGEWVEVSLYWQATQPLHENYAHSVRLLKPPTGEVVAQVDVLLGPPTQPSTNVWPLNHIFRTRAYLETDQFLSAPASYWLSVNVWRAPWDSERSDNMLIVSQTSQPLLLPDTVVLQDVVFLSPTTPFLLLFIITNSLMASS